VIAHHIDAVVLLCFGPAAGRQPPSATEHCLSAWLTKPSIVPPLMSARAAGNPMGTAEVLVIRIVKRRLAAAVDGVRQAYAGGDPLGAGVGAEVGVEGAVSPA